MTALSPEEKLCLLSMKTTSSAAELSEFATLMAGITDYSRLVRMASDVVISAMLYNRLKQSSTLHLLPSPLHSELKATATMVLARTIRFLGFYDQIATAFGEAGIDFMPLKGMLAIDRLYKSFELRVMSDIDLLVQPTDGERSLEVLKNIGYISHGDILLEKHKNSEIIHYPQLVKEGVCVELHVKLHRKIERYSLPVELLFANSSLEKVHNRPCRVMDKHDALIYTCLHLDRHFKDGHTQFTSFADIVNMVLTNEINWYTLATKCKQYNCEKEVFSYILLLDAFYNFTIDAFVYTDYSRYNKPATTQLFLNYLNGYRGFSSGMPKHLSAILHFSSVSEIIKYSFTILFPPSSFMISKFKLKNKRLLWFYYIYRWWLGLKGVGRGL